MKKIILVLGSMFFLFGGQSYATPFITETGVVSSTVTVNGTTFDVTNEAWDDDIWNSSISGFSYDSKSTTSGYLKYSGYYLGTFSGNTSEATIEALVGYYLDVAINFDWYKVEGSSGTTGPLTVFSNSGNQSGEWSMAVSDPQLYVSFYTVKAGDQFALYFVSPGAVSGYWSTIHDPVGQKDKTPEISHLDALASQYQTPDPHDYPVVPEPGTMLLFGTGLVGLAGFARRKRS